MKSIAPLLAAVTLVASLSAPAAAQWSTDSLSGPRAFSTAATVGDLAIFAGGTDTGFNALDVVDIYDAATDSWSSDTLSAPRVGLGVAVLGDLVFFAGGAFMEFAPPSDVVDILDTSTMTWMTASLSQSRVFAAGTTVGNKVLFAGGEDYDLVNGPIYSNVVDIYDADLGAPDDPLAWSATTLTQARTGLSAVTVGNLALFAGGRNGNTTFKTVNIYDSSIGLPGDPAAWSVEQLSFARPIPYGSAAAAGTLAFFAGGQFTASPPFLWSNIVDIYDAQTGTWSTETMSVARSELAVQVLGDTVLFAGGATGPSYSATDIVDRYDLSTGQWGPVSYLSEPAFYMSSTTVAGKVMFAGGAASPSEIHAKIDVYEPAPWNDLGGSTAGANGTPWLNGEGSLIGGTSASMSLKFAPPGALSLAWISLAPAAFPAIGGTVHAFPFISQLSFFVDGEGSFDGTTTWPIGIAPGTEVTFQFLVQDASSIHGITLSNGLLATAP